jgi:type IV pilus assembly protein PilO
MEFSLAKLPWYGQVGAFVAVGAAALTVYSVYYEMPAKAEQHVQQGRLQSLRDDVGKGRQTAKKLQELQSVVWKLEDRLESLRAIVPEERDAADLLRRMQTAAAESGLTIKSFKPAPMVARQLYAEWPIALVLDGTYRSLTTFFDRVGQFTPIVTVTELDVKGKDQPVSNSSVTASCIATSFVLLGKAVAPKPAGRPLPQSPPADKTT